tara:strand:- start:118 stop:285 length:168 start_codon:yes stop_codon:yes gene_type:complete
MIVFRKISSFYLTDVKQDVFVNNNTCMVIKDFEVNNNVDEFVRYIAFNIFTGIPY